MFAELFVGSTNNPNYVREANVGPIKNWLYKLRFRQKNTVQPSPCNRGMRMLAIVLNVTYQPLNQNDHCSQTAWSVWLTCSLYMQRLVRKRRGKKHAVQPSPSNRGMTIPTIVLNFIYKPVVCSLQ